MSIIIDLVYDSYLVHIGTNQIVKFVQNPVNDFDQ